jgi:hypothetical protein
MTTTIDRPQEAAVSGSGLPNKNAVAIVPGQEMYTSYVSRKVGGVVDMEMFAYAHSKKYNVLIEGPTGAGKTSGVLAYAAKNMLPFYSTPSSIGLEPSQLFGRFIPDEDHTGYVWQDGPITHLVRYGGVLLINEINFIPSRVSTVLFSLLDKRRTIQLLDHRGEVLTAHDDLLIVADMNPDYKGTAQLNAALRNRFAIQQYWDYDPAVESKLVPYPELVRLAVKLRVDAENITTPTTTNMLQDFVVHAKDMGWDFAVDAFATRYAGEERAAVAKVLELHETLIKKQLFDIKAKRAKATTAKKWEIDEYDPTIPGTKDNPNPMNYPEWEPDWGVYLEDWVIEVEEVDDDEA